MTSTIPSLWAIVTVKPSRKLLRNRRVDALVERLFDGWQCVGRASSLADGNGDMREPKAFEKRDETIGCLEHSRDDLGTIGGLVPGRDQKFLNRSVGIDDPDNPSAVPNRRFLLCGLRANDLGAASVFDKGLEQSLCNHIRSAFA